MAIITAFLDRDGVINRKLPEGDCVKSRQEFEFLPGVFDALRSLKQREFRLIVVTNQRGVALGKLLEADLQEIHREMMAELRQAGAALDAIYYCPHHRNTCECRKPQLGLFQQAQRDFPDIEFSRSFMIGDSDVDMEAGQRLGCKNVLIASAGADIAEALAKDHIKIDFSAPSLLDAVREYLLNARLDGVQQR